MLKVQRSPVTHVNTANNQDARIEGRVSVRVRIGPYEDRLSLLVMQHQLEGIDIILGTDWMRRRKVQQDFSHEGVVRVLKGGKRLLLLPRTATSEENTAKATLAAIRTQCADNVPQQMISAKRAMRLVKFGARALMLRVCLKPVVSVLVPGAQAEPVKSDVPGVEELLHEFSDVFKELDSLPDERPGIAHSPYQPADPVNPGATQALSFNPQANGREADRFEPGLQGSSRLRSFGNRLRLRFYGLELIKLGYNAPGPLAGLNCSSWD